MRDGHRNEMEQNLEADGDSHDAGQQIQYLGNEY